VRPSLLFVLLIALVVIAVLGREREQWSWVSVLAPHAAVFALAFGAPLALQMMWPVSMDSSPVLAAQLLCLARTVGSELERRAREIFRQRAVNVRQQALVTLAVKDSSDGIVVTDASAASNCATSGRQRCSVLAIGRRLSARVFLHWRRIFRPIRPNWRLRTTAGSRRRIVFR